MQVQHKARTVEGVWPDLSLDQRGDGQGGPSGQQGDWHSRDQPAQPLQSPGVLIINFIIIMWRGGGERFLSWSLRGP